MNDFSFLFALYSLMLGLSIVELLGGLGRVMEVRLTADRDAVDRVVVGWLTPLLAVFVMLDLVSFWMAAWTVRDMVAVRGPLVLGLVVFARLRTHCGSQKMTVAAMQMAEKKVWAHRS